MAKHATLGTVMSNGVNIVQCSCALTATSHNPSILNPDWLIRFGVVDESWKLAQPFISTPPFAQIKYTNGVVITFEQAKISILLENPETDSDVVPALAASIVKLLKHVPYSGIGINFQAAQEIESPSAVLRDTLVAPGPWIDSKAPDSVTIKFVYGEDDNNRANYTIAPGKKLMLEEGENVSDTVLIFEVNFHSNLLTDDIVDEILAHLERFKERQVEFRDYVESFTGRLQ